MRNPADPGGAQAVFKIAQHRCDAALLHGPPRSVQKSYLVSRLRFQGSSLTARALVLACEFGHANGIMHTSLRISLPSAGKLLLAEWAHFDVVFIGSSLADAL
jgi:hypothetical protein